MPKLVPTDKFLADIEKFRSNKAMRKKIAKTMTFLENNPHHPGLALESGQDLEALLDLLGGHEALLDGVLGEVEIDLCGHGDLGNPLQDAASGFDSVPLRPHRAR